MEVEWREAEWRETAMVRQVLLWAMKGVPLLMEVSAASVASSCLPLDDEVCGLQRRKACERVELERHT